MATYSKKSFLLTYPLSVDKTEDLPAGSILLTHVPLLGGYDEPETPAYQFKLFGPLGADPGLDLSRFSAAP